MEIGTISYDYVDNQEKLAKAAEEMSGATELGIDIECENNLHHYGVYIAIIQISSNEKNWIIDVLSCETIDALKPIFHDEQIIKIFHDVNFDLRALNSEFGIQPKNVFDTSVAATLLGKEKTGLGALLEEYFGIEKESKFQRVDWTKRPLTDEMLRYAVKDSLYLIKLKAKLSQELGRLGRLKWVEEECKYLEDKTYEVKYQQYDEVKGFHQLNEKERSAFENLFTYREKVAEKMDKPPFQIIRPKTMFELVHLTPSQITKNELKGTHPYIRNHLKKVKELVYKGLKSPQEIVEETPKRLSKKQREMRYYLDDLRKEIAEKLSLSPATILTNDQIIEVVTGNFDALREWQKDVLENHEEGILEKVRSLN